MTDAPKLDGRTRAGRAAQADAVEAVVEAAVPEVVAAITTPTRADAERSRRRHRGAIDTTGLAVPDAVEAKLSAEGKSGRWINDLGPRLHNMTAKDDWEKVPEVEPVQVGVDQRTGQPIKAYYCAKPSEWLAEDRADRMARITEQEQAMVRGSGGVAVEGSYQPNTQNRIGKLLG